MTSAAPDLGHERPDRIVAAAASPTIQAPRPGPHATRMSRTIFETPVVNTAAARRVGGFLRLNGWKVEGALPARRAQGGADRGAAHQQLGPALHADGGLLPAAEHPLDGQASLFRGPSAPDALAGRHCHQPRKEQQRGGRLRGGLAAIDGPCNWWCRPKARAAARGTGRRAFTSSRCRPRCPSSWPTWTTSARSAAWARSSRPPATWTRHGRDQAFYLGVKGRRADQFESE
jgi:hypothetical protein